MPWMSLGNPIFVLLTWSAGDCVPLRDEELLTERYKLQHGTTRGDDQTDNRQDCTCGRNDAEPSAKLVQHWSLPVRFGYPLLSGWHERPAASLSLGLPLWTKAIQLQ